MKRLFVWIWTPGPPRPSLFLSLRPSWPPFPFLSPSERLQPLGALQVFVVFPNKYWSNPNFSSVLFVKLVMLDVPNTHTHTETLCVNGSCSQVVSAVLLFHSNSQRWPGVKETRKHVYQYSLCLRVKKKQPESPTTPATSRRRPSH